MITDAELDDIDRHAREDSGVSLPDAHVMQRLTTEIRRLNERVAVRAADEVELSHLRPVALKFTEEELTEFEMLHRAIYSGTSTDAEERAFADKLPPALPRLITEIRRLQHLLGFAMRQIRGFQKRLAS